jgi:hypothetical protein
MVRVFSRQQPQASTLGKKENSGAGEGKSSSISPTQSQTSLNRQDSLSRVKSPPNLAGGPASAIPNIRSSSTSQGQWNAKQDDAIRIQLRRNDSSSGKDQNIHTSSGIGRLVKAGVQSPMDLSMGITTGFHNAPKLWGDDTVRRPQRVSDIKSGFKAMGKEFGYGWYDGVTGLFTQPWKSAQKEGTSGFFKGIGGFVTKPGAALFGIPGYMMKGVHKEVQKLYGSNVQNYIVTSRAAQGYEEWLQSSDEEKEDIIVQWKLIQKYLKKKTSTDEMMRDVFETQRRKNQVDRQTRQTRERTASFASSGDAPSLQDSGIAMLAMGASQSTSHPGNSAPEESLGAAEINETIRLLVQETSRGDAEEDVGVERAMHENVSQLQRQRHETADHQAEQDSLHQALASSEAEAQLHASEALEYENQLKQVMAQSLRDQRQRDSDSSGWELDMGLNDSKVAEFDRASHGPANIAAAGSPSVHRRPPPLSCDPGHLAGTTQSEFDASQDGQRKQKTTQEKTEEQIVLEYVKKQSLLEVHHQNKGKSRATGIENEEDEELQKAIQLSLLGRVRGEASGK